MLRAIIIGSDEYAFTEMEWHQHLKSMTQDDRYKSSPNRYVVSHVGWHCFGFLHICLILFCSSHEWYQSYKSLRHLLNPIHFAAQGNGVRAWNRRSTSTPINFPAREACRILILGCGNSQCGEDMRKGKI